MVYAPWVYTIWGMLYSGHGYPFWHHFSSFLHHFWSILSPFWSPSTNDDIFTIISSWYPHISTNDGPSLVKYPLFTVFTPFLHPFWSLFDHVLVPYYIPFMVYDHLMVYHMWLLQGYFRVYFWDLFLDPKIGVKNTTFGTLGPSISRPVERHTKTMPWLDYGQLLHGNYFPSLFDTFWKSTFYYFLRGQLTSGCF